MTWYLIFLLIQLSDGASRCKNAKKDVNNQQIRPSDALGTYQRDADRRLAAGKQSRSKLGPNKLPGSGEGRAPVWGGQGIGKFR